MQSALRPEQFKAELAEAEASGGINPDAIAVRFRDRTGSQLLDWFDTARAELLNTFKNLDPRARLPWFGPAMSAASSLTARIMETWAHTQDIADALGVTREPTDRLRHVAHIGVGARAFSYAVHGKSVPAAEIRVELTGPDGTAWTWGPAEADNRVSGPALDFCLLVTQRRHRNDLALDIEGPAAIEWMAIAQAFAGAAGTGRPRTEVRRWLGRSASRTAPGSTATASPPPGRCSIRVRPGRRADRRLPGRADHADPVEGAAEGSRPRLRDHVPAADGGGARHLPGAGRQGRRQRRRPQPRGPGREAHGTLRPGSA